MTLIPKDVLMAGGIVPLADGGARIAARELIAALWLRERGAPLGRPRVVAAMIESIDGRAAVQGRSVGLGNPDDRAVLRELRGGADAVLVGAATVRSERYANLLDAEHVEARAAAGLTDRPLVAVLTRSGDVPWDVGLFSEPDARVAIYTATDVAVPDGIAAQVEVHFAADPAEALAHLRAHHVAELVLCEGGPRVLHAVIAGGLLDDLLLTVAPLLVGGDAPSALAGPPVDPPARLALAGVWRSDDHAFLHYTA